MSSSDHPVLPSRLRIDPLHPEKHFTSKKKKMLLKLIAFVGVIAASTMATLLAERLRQND
jgi:hypothetical protein